LKANANLKLDWKYPHAQATRMPVVLQLSEILEEGTECGPFLPDLTV
ncbi:MAG: hypothetical protein V7606_1636, partial [Burkholderiales bacterium]